MRKRQAYPDRKARMKYWKDILKLQSKGTMKSTTGKKLPILKKGSKQYEIVMTLAEMSPKEIYDTAKEYYSMYPKIRKLVSWYKKGTERQERKKEGRKYITITVGFKPRHKAVAQLIRHAMANHERGMVILKKRGK